MKKLSCKCLMLCDRVIVEKQTEKLSIVGNFWVFILPSFPAKVGDFSVFAQLTDGMG